MMNDDKKKNEWDGFSLNIEGDSFSAPLSPSFCFSSYFFRYRSCSTVPLSVKEYPLFFLSFFLSTGKGGRSFSVWKWAARL